MRRGDVVTEEGAGQPAAIGAVTRLSLSAMRGRWTTWLGRMGAAAVLLDAFAVGAVLLRAGSVAPCADHQGNPERPVGAVVFYGDEGAMTAARVESGVDLLKSGAVDELYFVGGWRPLAERNGAEQMAAKAREQGGDAARIDHDAGSYDSISSVANALEHAHARDLGGLVFVSDQLHLARLIPLFRAKASEAGYQGALGWRCAPADLSPLTAIARAHHEAAAIALTAVAPEEAQRAITGWLRGQGEARP